MKSSLGTFHFTDDPGVADALQAIVGPVGQIQRRLKGLADKIDFESRLLRHSGRWEPSSIEPTEYFPGDVPIIRSIIGGASCRSTLRTLSHHQTLNVLNDVDGVATFIQTLAVDAFALYHSQPFFVPSELALTIAESEPPSEELLDEVRLPFPSVWVGFGRDLSIPEQMTWPPDMQPGNSQKNPFNFLPFKKGESEWKHNVLEALFLRGGAITGLVLYAGPDGKGLADHMVWIVSANPDPDMPALYRQDAQRGGLFALRSQSLLSPIVSNFAVAVAGAQWRQARDDVSPSGERGSDQWFKSLERDRAQRALRLGAFSGVHTIDLEATRRQIKSSRSPEDAGGDLQVAEHMRRGHPHRYRVAKRNEDGKIVGSVQGEKDIDWSYRILWIPPTIVNPGMTKNPVAQVWRLPDPEIIAL